MYPKTTFSKKQMISVFPESVKQQTYKSGQIEHSHLIFHSEAGCSYHQFDIDMPYLILYESFHIPMDSFTYMEFSEDNKIYASKSLSGTTDDERALHSHDFYELTFVLSGELTMRIEDEILTYYPGECCLCNKNIHHTELKDTTAEIVLFLLKENFIKEVFEGNYYYDTNGEQHTLGTLFHTFIIENKKNPFYDAKTYMDFRLNNDKSYSDYLKLINKMIEIISDMRSGKSHMMKALICRFVEMMEDTEIHHSEIHWAKLSVEEQIVSTISNAYRNKLGIFTRAEIEDLTGYNSDYVERIMKRNTGKTLSNYGKNIMVQKIALFLTDSTISIGEICETFGYSNRNYFNKLFIRQYGMTPSEYRAKYKGKGSL